MREVLWFVVGSTTYAAHVCYYCACAVMDRLDEPVMPILDR